MILRTGALMSADVRITGSRTTVSRIARAAATPLSQSVKLLRSVLASASRWERVESGAVRETTSTICRTVYSVVRWALVRSSPLVCSAAKMSESRTVVADEKRPRT